MLEQAAGGIEVELFHRPVQGLPQARPYGFLQTFSAHPRFFCDPLLDTSKTLHYFPTVTLP
jgi:hypothetical protein